MSRKEYYPARSKVLPGARRSKTITGRIRPVSVDERLATCGQPRPPALPIDSGLIPWDEILGLRIVTYPDGV